MQSANKAWWRDVTIYRSKDVPWRAKCRRMVEHVKKCILLSKRKLVLDSSHLGQNYKGWEAKGPVAFVPSQKKRRRNMGYCQGTARAARTIWTKIQSEMQF